MIIKKKIVRELGANEKEKEEIIFQRRHFDLILFRCYFMKPFNVMNREILIPLLIEFSSKFSLRRFLKRLSWNFKMTKEGVWHEGKPRDKKDKRLM